MRRARSAGQGWLLVGLIILLTSLFVALVGLTIALTEGRRAVSVIHHQTRAVYLAQAGIMEALYRFRHQEGIALGEQTIEDGGSGTSFDDVYLLGGKAADFLLVNMIPAGWGSPQRLSPCTIGPQRFDQFQNWTITNALRFNTPPLGIPIRIDRMTVSWTPDNGERLVAIDLNGRRLWRDCGGVAAGTEVDLPDGTPFVQVPPRGRWGTNRLWFNTTNREMQAKETLDVTFTMTDHVVSGDPLDASIRSAHYEADSLPARSAEFTLKSVGEVRKGAFPFLLWRRIQAEYRICAEATAISQCNSGSEETSTRSGRLLEYRELARQSP